MSPEIDYTRQRTVAELLAEHGEGGPAGRRQRRRGEGPHGPVPPPPPVGRRGPDGRPYPPDVGPARPPRRPHDAVPPGYRGSPPPRPTSGGGVPGSGRRERPTEMIGDRQRPPGPAGYDEGPYGPGPSRTAAPNVSPSGAERTTASGPVRAVSPATGQEARPAASGALRMVPTTGGLGTPWPNGRPATSRTAPPSTGPRDAAPPSTGGRAAASGPLRAAPSAAPGSWEAFRGAPNRARPVPGAAPATAAPAREQPAALREPVGRPYLPAAVPAPHRAGQGPGRAAAPHGRRPLLDPGPDTGAYDPFALDGEGGEDGPKTVVGRPRAPRRAPFPRLIEGPATDLDLGGGRRSDGPVTRVDPAGRARRDEDAATRFDVPELRRGAGTADFGTSGRPGHSDGPATDFDVTDFDVTALDVPVRPGPRVPAEPVGGPPPAPVRPAFGTGPRRTGSAPAPAAAPAPRVRPFARKVVDEPTDLTDRSLDELDGFDDIHDAEGFGGFGDLDNLDDRMDVAAPRRPAPPARGRRPGSADGEDDDPVGVDDFGDDVDGRFDDLDADDRDELVEREHDDHLDHLDHLDDLDDLDDADDDRDDERIVRPAQAWAGVVAQWLAGAIAGAVLWVLFRYLWRGLPVVALAAAVLVTAGLVLLVRQLLHQADRRTTGFAVMVGLLLTASPAVLVLLGR